MTGEISTYRDLIAWQKAFALGVQVHRLSRAFPKEELYALTSQIRRTVVSVASNIAEGYGRGSTADYLRFLKIARGSLFELDTQLLFTLDFEYIDRDTYSRVQSALEECIRVLAGLIRSLEPRS